MNPRTLAIPFLLGALAAPPAHANFGGGSKDEPQKPAPSGISSISLTPRQEAERFYADSHVRLPVSSGSAELQSESPETGHQPALVCGEPVMEQMLNIADSRSVTLLLHCDLRVGLAADLTRFVRQTVAASCTTTTM